MSVGHSRAQLQPKKSKQRSINSLPNSSILQFPNPTFDKELWNDLTPEIQQASTLNTFKHLLNRRMRIPPVPPYYFFGPRKLQVLHTRLRTGCSSLNAHLHAKNISDSPNCSCGDIETPAHFFLACPLYTQPRLHLLRAISQVQPPINPTLDVLLFGCEHLNVDQNKIIFQAVQIFVANTKRFD